MNRTVGPRRVVGRSAVRGGVYKDVTVDLFFCFQGTPSAQPQASRPVVDRTVMIMES